jgi:hypothetical protein
MRMFFLRREVEWLVNDAPTGVIVLDYTSAQSLHGRYSDNHSIHFQSRRTTCSNFECTRLDYKTDLPRPWSILWKHHKSVQIWYRYNLILIDTHNSRTKKINIRRLLNPQPPTEAFCLILQNTQKKKEEKTKKGQNGDISNPLFSCTRCFWLLTKVRCTGED